jgi:aspartate kinase
MALIVQKYGGTSVGSPERIKNVARMVAKFRAEGHQVVVVVSAMSGETNRLIALTKEVATHPSPRELDVVVSTGEQVTIGLLCMALEDIGVPAKSYTGAQVKILTDSMHTKARILNIDDAPIRRDLDEGKVVVVAGFQGVDEHGNITTLGRGGSDTTGVALAAALNAEECQIYTDVDGVYTTDPRIVPEAPSSTASPSRRCWRWPASARRCCRSAPSSSPASTACPCACCRASRPGTSRSRRNPPPAP